MSFGAATPGDAAASAADVELLVTPDADHLRDEMHMLSARLGRLATAAECTDEEGAKHLAQVAKILDVQRKALAGAYTQARDREMLSIVERYEAMKRDLDQRRAAARRSHQLDDEASH